METIINKENIILGKQGEYGHNTVRFDISPWVNEFGSGTINLIHKVGSTTYPIAVTVENNVASFVVGASHTTTVGYGELEYRFVQNNRLIKSVTFETRVLPSVSGTPGTAPSPITTWINEIDARLVTINADIALARGYKESAATSATNASTSESNALAYKNATSQLKNDTQAIKTAVDNEVTGFQAQLNNKVDKVTGKGLSTNDYTDAEKTKLAGIESGAEVNVQADWNQTDSTKPDYIKNKPTEMGLVEDVKVNGTSVVDSEGVANVTVPTKTSDLINDSNFVSDASYVHTDNNLTDTLKSNYDEAYAQSGSNYQDIVTLYADKVDKETGKGLFSGSYNDLTDKPTIPTVPTNVSAFTNDAGYLTEHQDISGKVDKVDGMGLSHNDFTDTDKNDINELKSDISLLKALGLKVIEGYICQE